MSTTITTTQQQVPAQHQAAPLAENGVQAPADTGLNPDQAKKVHALNEKDMKRQEKEQAKAVKSAQSDEKALRKAKKAEAQSIKRQAKAVKADHKASKKLNKAQAASKKAAAELQKANEEVEIKKRHTINADKAYEQAKARIQTTV